MEIRERQVSGHTVIELSGRLTVTDEPGKVKQSVANAVERGARKVLMDLSGVKYIDSTRLGELIAAHIMVSRQGGRLTLVGTPERIMELLEIAGLDGVFELYPSVEDAVRHHEQ